MEIIGKAQELLGTHVEIKLPQSHAFLFPFCFDELKRIEKTYSRFLEDSKLSKLNAKPNEWHAATKEMRTLIQKAEEFHAQTNGAFDITVKSSLDALGYDSKYSFKQTKAKEKNPKRPEIDDTNKRIRLNNEIDFGGFGKGFAIDTVAKLLLEKGVGHFYINAGGDIYAHKGNGFPPWTIILEHPDDPTRALATRDLDGQAIAASAPNRRKWGNSHHLIHPSSGKPAQNMKALFVLAQKGIEADAYATGLFCAGFEEAIALSKSLPVEVLLVSTQNKVYQSKGFHARFL